MDAIEMLKTRRSVRAYRDKPVAKEILEDIIDCARLAPSANNGQPWEFVVVTDPETRRQIADLTAWGKFIATAPACIVVFCKASHFYVEDGAATTENILLAARAHGLGSCWVAGDKTDYGDKIARLLGAPEEMKPISFLAVGYPAEEPVREKRPLESVLHWEKF
ncbi:MAG: nitroreductase family protein [Armatimonadetes bacterium]|nr:nitroreductase family protein [Armatimonadota bacterium]